jgi:hypothetical protein
MQSMTNACILTSMYMFGGFFINVVIDVNIVQVVAKKRIE